MIYVFVDHELISLLDIHFIVCCWQMPTAIFSYIHMSLIINDSYTVIYLNCYNHHYITYIVYCALG